jgi:hypothetical protein
MTGDKVDKGSVHLKWTGRERKQVEEADIGSS